MKHVESSFVTSLIQQPKTPLMCMLDISDLHARADLSFLQPPA